MNRLLEGFCLAVLVLLVVSGASLVKAQTASEHFGDDVVTGDTVTLRLKVKGLEPVSGTTAALTGGANSGFLSAAPQAINALCTAASPQLTCSSPCTFTAASNANFNCVNGAGVGFTINKPVNSRSFVVSPTIAANVIQSLHCKAPGILHGPDLLERVLVRVQPNGINGVVVFNVSHTQGGTNPRTFSVNTTGLSDQALHEAIRDGYNGMGLGFKADANASISSFLSFFPAEFSGNFVQVHYSAAVLATLQQFEVDGLAGQTVWTETAGPASPSQDRPALSGWGIAALIAAFALISLWMLLRRQRLMEA